MVHCVCACVRPAPCIHTVHYVGYGRPLGKFLRVLVALSALERRIANALLQTVTRFELAATPRARQTAEHVSQHKDKDPHVHRFLY